VRCSTFLNFVGWESGCDIVGHGMILVLLVLRSQLMVQAAALGYLRQANRLLASLPEPPINGITLRLFSTTWREHWLGCGAHHLNHLRNITFEL
jgi:hypothetical protein